MSVSFCRRARVNVSYWPDGAAGPQCAGGGGGLATWLARYWTAGCAVRRDARRAPSRRRAPLRAPQQPLGPNQNCRLVLRFGAAPLGAGPCSALSGPLLLSRRQSGRRVTVPTTGARNGSSLVPARTPAAPAHGRWWGLPAAPSSRGPAAASAFRPRPARHGRLGARPLFKPLRLSFFDVPESAPAHIATQNTNSASHPKTSSTMGLEIWSCKVTGKEMCSSAFEWTVPKDADGNDLDLLRQVQSSKMKLGGEGDVIEKGAFDGEGGDDDLDDTIVEVDAIEHSFNLQKMPMSKTDLKGYLKDYCVAIRARMLAANDGKGSPEIKAFMSKVPGLVKFLLGKFKDMDVFINEEFDVEGAAAFAFWPEGAVDPAYVASACTAALALLLLLLLLLVVVVLLLLLRRAAATTMLYYLPLCARPATALPPSHSPLPHSALPPSLSLRYIYIMPGLDVFKV